MTTATAVSAQASHAPAFRVRVRLLTPALNRLGIDVRPVPLLQPAEEPVFRGGSLPRRAQAMTRGRRRMLRELAEPSDVVLVQRQADLLPLLTVEKAARRAPRLVLDVDDAVWLDATADAGGHRLALLKGTKRKVDWLARSADHVIAGNEHLAEWLGQRAERLTIIPSVVDVESTLMRRHAEGPVLVLGWIGSPTTFPHLEAVAGSITAAARAIAPVAVELRVVGGAHLEVPGVRVTSLPWSEAEQAATLARMDIGLMPLPDNAWTRAKCAYKALLYMSAGIPVVADDVGISASAVGHGVGGLIPRTHDDWTDAIVHLGRDVDLRSTLGAAARLRVRDDWSVTRWAPVVADVIRGG